MSFFSVLLSYFGAYGGRLSSCSRFWVLDGGKEYENTLRKGVSLYIIDVPDWCWLRFPIWHGWACAP